MNTVFAVKWPAFRLPVLTLCLNSVLLLLSLAGCAERDATVATESDAPQTKVADHSSTLRITPEELRRKLRANELARFEYSGNDIVRAELFQSGVRSIEALRGVPLQYLDLGMTDVTDLSPLEQMPLKELILENTPVADISVLRGMQLQGLKLQKTKVTDLTPIIGMPLRQLNLMDIPVEDLEPFVDMPLSTLWIPGTKVTDLSPLKAMKLVSLDVQNTAVNSLEPLAEMTTLRRLNIAETPVSDLTPLKNLQLERLTLTPGRITSGIDVIRKMTSLTQIQPTVEEPIDAAEFWKRFDLGVWNELPETTKSEDPSGNQQPE